MKDNKEGIIKDSLLIIKYLPLLFGIHSIMCLCFIQGLMHIGWLR